jgi:hypothetical protein
LDEDAALVPQGLRIVEAASVPMSAHTAWQGLFEKGGLTESNGVPFVNENGKAVLGQAKGNRVNTAIVSTLSLLLGILFEVSVLHVNMSVRPLVEICAEPTPSVMLYSSRLSSASFINHLMHLQ